MNPLARLSFNQITVDPWTLDQAVRNCVESGVPNIAIWRHKLNGGLHGAAALIRDSGLRVSSLCRGGYFSAPTAEKRRHRIADNRAAIDEAASLGAPVLVIVSGPPDGQSLSDARAAVIDGLGEVLPDAEKAGITLGIEPLHPMYAAERSVVVTLKQANDIAEQLSSSAAGVVIDVFHVWWDPDVTTEVNRARGKIAGFHVSDWPVPLPGILMGRAMMGDGVIELRKFREMVDSAGYEGPIEVEIFNEAVWRMPESEVMDLIRRRFLEYVA